MKYMYHRTRKHSLFVSYITVKATALYTTCLQNLAGFNKAVTVAMRNISIQTKCMPGLKINKTHLWTHARLYNLVR